LHSPVRRLTAAVGEHLVSCFRRRTLHHYLRIFSSSTTGC
jgi:hypothetical protein